jgi:hypothetical protein
MCRVCMAAPATDGDLCENHDGKRPSPVLVYVYAWKNNERRDELHGRRCVIEATGSMGTALVRFLDTGERVTTSRRALRREARTA